MQSDKKFVGNAQFVQTQYGTMTKIGLNTTDLQNLMSEASKNPKGWVNLVMKTNKEGKPYIEVDDYEQRIAAAPTQPQGNWGNQAQQVKGHTWGGQQPPAQPEPQQPGNGGWGVQPNNPWQQ